MLASEIRILDAGRLIAVHPVLAGRDRRSLLPSHRRQPKGTSLAGDDDHLCGQANRWGPRLSDGSIPADPAELRSLARPCPRCGAATDQERGRTTLPSSSESDARHRCRRPVSGHGTAFLERGIRASEFDRSR